MAAPERWWIGSATGLSFENRVYTSLYTAEQIINWRVERVNGRNIPVLIVLRKCGKLEPIFTAL